MSKLRRIGNTEKCPACGWRIDADAYRCPKCRIYFCFKCRARVEKREEQFQCSDQSCECYGKLLCAACTVLVDQPATTSYEDAFTTGAIGGGIAIAVAFIVILAHSWSWWLLIPALIGGCWLGAQFPVGRQSPTTSQFRGCIQYRHPIKNL